MGLSFDDEESLNDSVGSLNFNNPPSDADSLQGVGSSGHGSMPPEERNAEDICFDNPPSDAYDDPNVILEIRRVGSSSSTSSTPPQERSENT